MCHWGAIIEAPVFSDQVIPGAGGNLYGTTVTVDQNSRMIKDVQAAVKHQAKCTVTIAEGKKRYATIDGDQLVKIL